MMTDGDTYDQDVMRLQKKQDWAGVERYCREVERRIRKLILEGAATEEDHRRRMQALLDLQTTYAVMDLPQKRLRAAQEFHQAIRKAPFTMDVLDHYFSFDGMAEAHVANNQAEAAREMFLCAGASMITRKQAEFLGNALIDLAALEREQADPQKAAILEELAKNLKRTSGKVQRAMKR